MIPTVAGPPLTANSSAGALPRLSTTLDAGSNRVDSCARIVGGADHLVALPLVLGAAGHLLDEPQLVVPLTAPRQRRCGR
jgi:hypothetical protein